MRNSHPIMTGIAAGAIIGTAAYMLTDSNRKAKHTSRVIKRNAGKALKTVGSAMENMSYMMK